eukprot:10028108-Alexandrium_andersonii.AAC.1
MAAAVAAHISALKVVAKAEGHPLAFCATASELAEFLATPHPRVWIAISRLRSLPSIARLPPFILDTLLADVEWSRAMQVDL